MSVNSQSVALLLAFALCGCSSGNKTMANADGDNGEPACEDACDEGQVCNEAKLCVDSFTCPPPALQRDLSVKALGESFVTYVSVPEAGNVAVKVTLPPKPRYLDRMGVVVNVATFFTTTRPFYTDLDATKAGLIHVSYIWPGNEDPMTTHCSEGIFDHGGPTSMAALARIVQYAMGDIEDINGNTIDDRVVEDMNVDFDNVGLWAFSHPGIAAMNVLGRYQDVLSNVAYFVGRENPTQDQHSCVEMGHFSAAGLPVLNPAYEYPDDYTPSFLSVDYSTAKWDAEYIEAGHEDEPGRAYFDFDSDGHDTDGDHTLSFRIPSIYGKRYLSRTMTQALRDNGLGETDWPADLATPEEANEMWAYRISTDRFPELSGSGLRVMLVFAQRQHVQPLPDAVSVHSAYDGFKSADLWVRINPDQAYADWAGGGPETLKVNDQDANTEPADWAEAGALWGYPGLLGHGPNSGGEEAGLAAVAEMADRVEFDNWQDNLDATLIPAFPSPNE